MKICICFSRQKDAIFILLSIYVFLVHERTKNFIILLYDL